MSRKPKPEGFRPLTAGLLGLLNLLAAVLSLYLVPTATLFEQAVVGLLIFVALGVLEIGLAISWLGAAQTEELRLWEIRSEIEEVLSNIRANLARVLEEARADNDLYVDHFLRELRALETLAHDAAYKRELRVVCHHFQSVSNVMSAFQGEKNPVLRYVWILDEDRLFEDSSWEYYFKYTAEMVRDRTIKEVRALLVVRDASTLEHPSKKRLLQFFRFTNNMQCRYMLDSAFQVRGADGGLLSQHVDFGIYGSRLVFRTETYEPETAGSFSKDPNLVDRYTRFFDDLWRSGSSDNPHATRDRISVEELIDQDAASGGSRDD